MDNIQIKTRKAGNWKPKTVYDAYVDDEYVGAYPSHAEAKRAALARVKNNAQYWKSLGEDFE